MNHTEFGTAVPIILALAMAAPPLASVGQNTPKSGARADVRLDVSRDTWISAVGREADGNNGAAPRLKLKSIQEMTLLDVDLEPYRGRTIRSAALHFRKAGDEILKRVTVSSVGADWAEGTGTNYAIAPGGATFRNRRHPDLPWAANGGDICHVILGNGGTSWQMADASEPDGAGWQHVPVDVRIIAARLAGISHGFLAFDDTGSEWTRNGEKFTFRLFPNRFAYSREQNRASAPYFTIETGQEDRRAPQAPAALRVEPATAFLPAGEAIVSWVTPKDAGPAGTLGFFATLDGTPVPRELIPLAGAPGTRVDMHLRDMEISPEREHKLVLQAVDAAGNRGPETTASLRVSAHQPANLPGLKPVASPGAQSTVLPRVGGFDVAIIDELDKINPSTGEMIPAQDEGYSAANHLWNAATRRVSLQAARNEFVAFQVMLRGDSATTSINGKLAFDGSGGKAIQAAVERCHLVPAQNGLMPDPIVPLSLGPVNGERLKIRTLHVEMYVPHELSPGEYNGTLELTGSAGASGSSSQSQATLRLPVTLQVWDFTLPDHLSFLPEMNCYGLPDDELDYYRLAHRHRTVLNRVPYNQSGQVQDGCAPIWDKSKLTLDWSRWDRRFGPLFDGSAFADLPRKGVPVDCFYLPLHENWPSPMEGNFNGSYWADLAFPDSYRRAFVAAAKEIAAHLVEKKWNETLFQGFLNNKNNFKANGWSRGSSPWLLDEPASFQDYWALRYFAQAFHEGINQAKKADQRASATGPRLVFRADISRPQWRRDSLDGLLDYHVVGSAMREYPRLVFERKRTLGEIVLEYGSTNSVEGSNVQPVAWCLDVWCRGADGVIPWQTIGNSDSWQRADELALFYPAPPARSTSGRTRPGSKRAPIPSIRLKSYRRGEQDVEYLTLWSQLHNEPRWAVGQSVREALGLAGKRQASGFTGGEDAGRMDYGRLRPQQMWALRVAIGEDISRAHPPAKRKLVEFRTPGREPHRSR